MIEKGIETLTSDAAKDIYKTMIKTAIGGVCMGFGKAIMKQNEKGFETICKVLTKKEE